MRSPILIMLFLAMTLAAPADARDLCVKRQIEGYAMSALLPRNPPVLGKNEIRIEIKDSRGKPAADASVAINYSMPPMPGMPPMNYTVPATLKGSVYVGQMDLIMRGPWNIVVKSTVSGKVLRMAVVIDVR